MVLLTYSSSSKDVAEVVIERNPTALQSEGHRTRSSTPIAPSCLVYFRISSIVMFPKALMSCECP